MGQVTVSLLRNRLLPYAPGLIKTVESLIRIGQIGDGVTVVRIKSLGLAGEVDGFFVLPYRTVDQRSIVERNSIARISLAPLGVYRESLFRIDDDLVEIVCLDIKLLALAGPVAQFVSFL